MFLKASTIVALMTVLRMAAASRSSVQSGEPSHTQLMQPIHPTDRDDVDYYDCTGKSDGNYIHPFSCHYFIKCHSGRARLGRCEFCHEDPLTCPDGQLSYYAPSDRCEYYDIAGCVTDPTGNGDA
ncbi:hypothetical protein V500_00051 [Pseudogymnoascus sp. VKM F-4518 (FW-2643)]|nr:hypothetical protein V500_00051 [Pseudogymnoascus sp. VKM F-4518 (FW-2643)]